MLYLFLKLKYCKRSQCGSTNNIVIFQLDNRSIYSNLKNDKPVNAKIISIVFMSSKNNEHESL